MSPESENIQMEMQDNYDRKYPHKYKMEYIQNISMLKFFSFSFSWSFALNKHYQNHGKICYHGNTAI